MEVYDEAPVLPASIRKRSGVLNATYMTSSTEYYY